MPAVSTRMKIDLLIPCIVSLIHFSPKKRHCQPYSRELNLLTQCLISFLIEEEVSSPHFGSISPSNWNFAPIHHRSQPNKKNAQSLVAEERRKAVFYARPGGQRS